MCIGGQDVGVSLMLREGGREGRKEKRREGFKREGGREGRRD